MRFRTHDQACFQNLTSTRVESSSECFANGSITALVVKVEAATQMIPSQLTLRDPSCKPTFSNNRLAYFSFNASSCQTTRKVCSHFMSPLLLVEMFTILSSCIRLPVPRWYHDLSERSLDGQQDRCCPAVAKHHKRCSRIWVLCSTWVYSEPPPLLFFFLHQVMHINLFHYQYQCDGRLQLQANRNTGSDVLHCAASKRTSCRSWFRRTACQDEAC